MRKLGILALLLLLSGCILGPDYRRPPIETPSAFLNLGEEARGAVDVEWWIQFQDPVLDRLIADALVGNKSVQIAAANVERAAGGLTRIRAPLFPQLSYGGSAARLRISEANALPIARDLLTNPRNDFQLFAGASWEIDLWGRVRRLSEAGRADFYASQEARRGVILSLVAAVAGNYLQLRGLDEQLAVARRNLAAYAESVDLFQLQFEHGQVSQITLEQAKSQYETAAAIIPQLEAQIVQLENTLAILLGRNPGAIARGKSIHQLAFPAVPAGLPAQLLERRPDLRQAEQNLIAANAQIGAAKALYFPAIVLTGDYGYQSAELSDLFQGPARIWSFVGSLAGPIFTAGAISGQVRQATAGQQAALIGYLDAIQRAFADVENALIVRTKLVDQIRAQERLVRAGREYENLARLQFDGGYAPYLTVLSAQQQLFPAELDLVQARAALLVAYVNLYKAMGGGWVAEAERLTGGVPTGAPPAGRP